MFRFVNLETKLCICKLTNKSPNANKLSCGINHCYLLQRSQFLLHVLLSWGLTLHVLHCILHLYCIAPCGHALHCGHCYLARQSEDKQDLQIWCLTPPWHHHHCQHHHSHYTSSLSSSSTLLSSPKSSSSFSLHCKTTSLSSSSTSLPVSIHSKYNQCSWE